MLIQNVTTAESMVSDCQPEFLYKILSEDEWESSGTDLSLGAIDSDFIHLATDAQVESVIAKFWSAFPRYVYLKLDAALLGGRLVYESNRPGGDKYYHLYQARIPKAAVIEVQVREQ